MTSQTDAYTLISKLLLHVEQSSMFLGPDAAWTLDAQVVFDAIREWSSPPITKEEFNEFVRGQEGGEERG